jgi:hypothetical protein
MKKEFKIKSGKVPFYNKTFLNICERCNKEFQSYDKNKKICDNHSYRGPSYQYIVRLLTKGNKTGDAYGLTIPVEIVEKYKLFHKKFNIEIKNDGKFILYAKI